MRTNFVVQSAADLDCCDHRQKPPFPLRAADFDCVTRGGSRRRSRAPWFSVGIGWQSRGCFCPIPVARPPAARLLLSCLQRPGFGLARDASSWAVERWRTPCALSAQGRVGAAIAAEYRAGRRAGLG
jgi:hypothetical protein